MRNRPARSSAARTDQWLSRKQILLVAVLAVSAPSGVTAASLGASKLPVSSAFGVSGAPGKLPCVVIQRQMRDTPVLVLWYKDGARLPFFTLDLREGGDKKEFVDHDVRGRVRSDLSGSFLTFDPLVGSDTGIYKCRVDFENSPTLAALVNLTVYVVPSRLVVVTRENRQVTAGFLGPLTEGEALTLYCVVTGGRPTPHVTWWRGPHLLPSTSVTIGSGTTPLASHEVDDPLMTLGMDLGMGLGIGLNERRVRAEVRIPSLTRDYARANLTCRAQNNNITEPLSTAIMLDLYLRPATVEIKAPKSPLQEGKTTQIKCLSSGSYPAAVVSWEITQAGDSRLLPAKSHNIGDTTTSVLEFVPEARDHGATLTCRAHNPNISGKGIRIYTVLQVHFAPRVKLRLGANLQGKSITEGVDLYFECEVACNPPTQEILWHKDGERVHHQPKSGILISSKNLVLQNVRRSSAGNYVCSAENSLGATTSNVVPLSIRYLPVCVGGTQAVAVAEGEDVRLTCEVDAQPEDNLHFTWYFNNTLDTVEVERHRIEVRPGHSFLDYTPRWVLVLGEC
ncbi:nephrin-like [Penaeus japonicus]|uniref:nephrin-like n=1 Tax=Penaeus japonicus TaxID=27405 RepID=UPI001C70BA52|nr:nephrin-like [Penaeus japonicus]